MKILKKLSKIFLNVICIFTVTFIMLALCYVLQITVFQKKYADVLGFSLFEVLTGSMDPTIKIADDVFVKITTDVKVGDIVVFDDFYNDDFIIHRIVSINENSIITKGDNNNTYDTQISKDRIIGKVLFIFPRLGKVQNFFRKPFVFIPLIDIVIISTLVTNFRKKPNDEVDT